MDEIDDTQRIGFYERLRGNMLVVDIRPSLILGQTHEAVAWLEGHKRRDDQIPTEVEWSAGKNFHEVVICRREEDPYFGAAFNYYGPMAIQARIKFADGTTETGHVYARMPESRPI